MSRFVLCLESIGARQRFRGKHGGSVIRGLALGATAGPRRLRHSGAVPRVHRGMPRRRVRDGEADIGTAEQPSADTDLMYQGQRDPDGRPHGRGRQRLDESGVWHEGRFVRGERQGRGTLRFPPDDWDPDGDGDGDHDQDDCIDTKNTKTQTNRFPPGGDRLAGTFVDGVVHGPAVYTSADGSQTSGMYIDGSLGGSVIEKDASGKTVFKGQYADGVRHGHGVLLQPDGAVVVSNWHDNAMSREALFLYPVLYGTGAVPIDSEKQMCKLKSRVTSYAEALKIVENVTTPALYGGFGHEGNRDSREGEDLFLRRHDFDGNILPGSTWAHFDESRSDEHAYYQVRPDGAFPNPGTVVTAPT